jgi:hypothetical protein
MPQTDVDTAARATDGDCRTCGACCDTDPSWPRFTLESDAALSRLPADLVGTAGMRCIGTRCAALDGVVGHWATCRVYPDRPLVCRDCLRGDDACTDARARRGWSAVESPVANAGVDADHP